MTRFIWNFLAIFISFFILTFEFEYSILPNIYEWINPFFEQLISFSGEFFFGLKKEFPSSISSDSVGLYVHFFNLIWVSLLATIGLSTLKYTLNVNLRQFVLKLLIYYLSVQLLIYGFDKVFKAQFFLPEPNTLFTPLKDISKDLLYWSTIGISRPYSIFLGMTEVIVACLLLFKKTRLLGIIIGVGIMANVVVVNFSFNISVKVYSLFLFSGFLILLSPYFKFLIELFFCQNVIDFPKEKELISFKSPKLKTALKSFLILTFFVEAFFPFVNTQNFNDDSFPRPKFHGAYQITNSNSDIKNAFIHRRGYLIFQNQKDEFQDFQLEIDTVNKQLLLFDYRTKSNYALTYQFDNNSLIHISGVLGNIEVDFDLLKHDLNGIPLLKDNFSWTTK